MVARLFLLVFFGIGVYLLISNLMLRDALKKISKAAAIIKDKDSKHHKKLETDMRSGIEEKYRADMVSYKVVIKRLQQKKIK